MHMQQELRRGVPPKLCKKAFKRNGWPSATGKQSAQGAIQCWHADQILTLPQESEPTSCPDRNFATGKAGKVYINPLKT